MWFLFFIGPKVSVEKKPGPLNATLDSFYEPPLRRRWYVNKYLGYFFKKEIFEYVKNSLTLGCCWRVYVAVNH